MGREYNEEIERVRRRVHTRGGEGKNNRCRKSRCQTFSLSLRSGRTIRLAGHKNETITTGEFYSASQLREATSHIS